jgi:predicted nucleic acid-binding protein
MARSVLIDTGYFVALLDPRDNLNARALTVARSLASESAALVTTDAVVLEVANYFCKSPLRTHAAKWIRAVRAARGWEIVPLERALLLRAEERYGRHADKNWSLTDCHSMELMRARRLRDVATADAGFQQAGFRCLLRDD